MRKCRFCSKEIDDSARVCVHCGAELAAPLVTTAPTPAGRAPLANPPPPRRRVSAGTVIRKIVWSIALLSMAASAVNGTLTFAIQTGAPQQAAAAASACFQMIVPYVLARAIDALTRD